MPGEPSRTDALAASTMDSPSLSVPHGCTGFRTEKTEPLDAAKERA